MHRALLLGVALLGACSDDDTVDDGDRSAFGSPAVGIRIDWVEANQGVGVVIADAQGAVVATERSAPLVPHRRTLMRAFWAIDDAFVPRPIRAVLRLATPDGRQGALEVETFVDGPTSLASLASSFAWGVTEDFAVPGATYDIELFESDPAFADGESPPQRFPAAGAFELGIEPAPARLHTVLVPIRYDDGDGCSTLPDTSPATLQYFHDTLFMMSPVEHVQLDLHEPIAFDERLESLSTLNTKLVELRARENAAPEIIYYGLVDICRADLDGVVGQAVGIPAIPPRRDEAHQRVASGLWRSSDLAGSAETFVHELGHTLGRTHVACRGDEGRSDPTYPVPRGAIGDWGFGVLDLLLRHPSSYADYMTYCHPAWVSRWGWNKVYPVVREMTTWTTAAFAEAPRGRMLLGVLLPSGAEHWTTTDGTMDPGQARATIPFEAERADGSLLHLTGFEFALPERDVARLVMLPLPDRAAPLRRLVRIEGGSRFAVPAEAID